MFQKSTIPKFLLLLFGLVLLYTKPTDADLVDTQVISGNTYTATTLDFSNRSTTNSSFKDTLFNVSPLIPGGWEVKAIKVKKDGKLGFGFSITSDIKSQNQACDSLNIRVLKDFNETFNDNLSSLNMSDALIDSSYMDYLLIVSLDPSNNASGTCLFDLVFTTNTGGGFSDEERLANQVEVVGK